MKNATGLFLLFIGMLQFPAHGEEFWAIVVASGKGDDFLLVFDPLKSDPPYRQLRCEKSLPLYIETMATAVKKIDGDVIVRAQGTIIRESGGERIREVGIKMVCTTPRANYSLLQEIKSWDCHTQVLLEENQPDPFTAPP